MQPHVYRIYIRATPGAVWGAITDPEVTRRYFHGTAFESTLESGSAYRYVTSDTADATAHVTAAVAVAGEIEIADPPSRLVMTWQTLYDPAAASEPASRVEWQLSAAGETLTRVDLVHSNLARSPATWASVRHGWVWILNNLKTLLETGDVLPSDESADPLATGAATTGEWHRAQAIDANNSIWDLLTATTRTADDDEELLRRAYAAAYHWQRARGFEPVNEVRATYKIAKAHLAVGNADVALGYARRCLAGVTANGLADFDLAYAHEVLARALYATGDHHQATLEWQAALTVEIADPEDKSIVESDMGRRPREGSDPSRVERGLTPLDSSVRQSVAVDAALELLNGRFNHPRDVCTPARDDRSNPRRLRSDAQLIHRGRASGFRGSLGRWWSWLGRASGS